MRRTNDRFMWFLISAVHLLDLSKALFRLLPRLGCKLNSPLSSSWTEELFFLPQSFALQEGLLFRRPSISEELNIFLEREFSHGRRRRDDFVREVYGKAKAKAIERNWNMRKEEEMICQISGESSHFTQAADMRMQHDKEEAEENSRDPEVFLLFRSRRVTLYAIF
ncbi:uncharacterized protein LOC144711393 [Wolffia australiana]